MPDRVPPRPPRPPRPPSFLPGRAGAGMRSGDWGGVRLGPDTDLTGISFDRIDRDGRPLVYAETILLAVGVLAGLFHGRGLRGSLRDTLVGYGIASYLAQWAGELERRQ